MTARIDEGLWAWKQRDNNTAMIALQQATPRATPDAPITLAYFGSSAFRITTPAGLSLMIDPWRNPPRGGADWYLFDFPPERVNIGLSTHAHFDHDALHVLSADVILDRLIGHYAFADVAVTGIADKHVRDSSHAMHDWAERARRLAGVRTDPPDNWRSFDNTLLLIETAGLRILHWGDNRPDPPDAVWARLGRIDIALLPIDGSQHVLSHAQADAIAARLGARIVVPHHYGIEDLTTPGSTLLPPDTWMATRAQRRWLRSGSILLRPSEVRAQDGLALCFGAHVAFDTAARRAARIGA
jgi:L-ascorbate metabolism protein UlaG (beta-lactamase superfamily)